MLFKFAILALFVAGSHAVDHKIFHNCSEIDFCRELRHRPPQEFYTPDLANIKSFSDSYTATVVLKPSDPEFPDLFLYITYENNLFRLKVREIGHDRYELPTDILSRIPWLQKLTNIEVNERNATITAEKNEVVITADPFKVIFKKERETRAVFNGNDLFLKHNSTSQIFSFGVEFPDTLKLYGIPAHADKLALRDTMIGGADPYRLKNMDVPNHETNSTMALYGSIPLLYGHGPNATTAVFLFNAAEQWIETRTNDRTRTSSAKFMVDSGSLDLFIFLCSSPSEVLDTYTDITGGSLMPPLWSLGYQQSRWNYDNQTDVLNVVRQLDEGRFPLDAMWLDIEYTDAKKYFTWDLKNFSDPIKMQKKLNATGRKLVTIIDPHIKVDSNYSVYEKALNLDLYIKNPDGTNFEGDCWPGKSSWIDFLNPNASEYYGNQYLYENFPHTTPVLAGIWNDMNEPAVFDEKQEKTIPFNVVHYGGVEHKNIHNIYGFLHHKSTHIGLMKRNQGKIRPFILTRSYFAGSQRYTAVWTGDNTAGWDHLEVSYAQCLTLSITGIPFCGADIGGFSGEPDLELLQRWYQGAVWLPFMREHATLNSKRREPFVHPTDVQDNIRRALQTRYQYIPLFYLKFFEHAITRSPILTPLFYEYPKEIGALAIDDQVLLGPVLAKVIAKPGTTQTTVYLPGGEDTIWYNLELHQVFKGNGTNVIPVSPHSSPVFFKGGSIIPTSHNVENITSTNGLLRELVLEVYLDKNDEATGRVYVDDGESFGYVSEEYSYWEFNCKISACTPRSISGKTTYSLLVIRELHFYRYSSAGEITKTVKSF